MGLSTSAKEIARHHGGKSASIVEVSHVFLSPQDVAAAHALVMLREAPLPRHGHLNVETGEVLAICCLVHLHDAAMGALVEVIEELHAFPLVRVFFIPGTGSVLKSYCDAK